MISKAQILIFNDIISTVYTEPDFDKMRKNILEMLETVVPHDYASYYLATDEPGKTLQRPVGHNLNESDLNRYLDEFTGTDYSRWVSIRGRKLVFKESDYFDTETREKEPYFQELLKIKDIYYALQATIAHSGDFLGVICLYRKSNRSDFSDDDIFLLEQLVPHLENRSVMQKRMNRIENSETTMDNKSFDAYNFVRNYSMTAREIEVLGLLLEGLSNEEICDIINISPNTLKKHSLNIYHKLGIKNRWELIKFKGAQI